MNVMMRIALVIVLLSVGFGAGFPIGRSTGFSTGSEWVFVQANILAREAGLFMPVNYETGQFRIMLKQPKHVYKSAWILADRHEDGIAFMSKTDISVNERIHLAQRASLQQYSKSR